MQKWFLHIDLDAFFASVEQLDHPEYRGKPVIVGGKPEDKRSVVSTASYEARAYGVHSAMPTSQAYKLCPNGIYVHGRMERYSQISYFIMQIIKNYSPDFLQMSIDEAFIDITGTEKLFGTPTQTALKIKEEIKEKTGLTVSIGIAPTKYLAKMASEVNKPDGLFCIEKGSEQEFMLNLPLKKVFGIGTKSLENLNRCGIFTTKELFEKPLETLQFMCGTNSGLFLYNAVRGTVEDSFEKKAKSHSISSETTFVNDITNLYTIETTILELCHGIIFRLLRENGFSRTVQIKIRYEDFSTFSIQQTFDKNILTLDSLYSKAKKLFEQKWEKNRGVRLIGVSLDNIENEEKPFQQDLFDDGSEKKQKVEKAILNLEKKHPEIKIHKARMLENLSRIPKILLLITTLSFFTTNILHSQENHAVQKGAATLLSQTDENIPEKEEPTKLFNWELNGYWKGSFDNSFLMTFGNNTDFATSFSIPIFKQEIDLSAKFIINDQWKFQMNFLDNYNKNTFLLSYDGKSYLNKFLLSNRNIVFPDYYSVNKFNYSPKGGSNEAPGFSLHFIDPKNNKYYADFLIRYDMTKFNSATFYGKKSINDTKILIQDFSYGKIIVIPDENALQNIKDIYVENPNGTYKDTNGKKYKKLSNSDYLISINQKIIILSKQSNSEKNANGIPNILITFNTNSYIDQIISNIGDYDIPNSYLGKIQTFFKSSDDSINLKKYSYNFTNSIGNENALVVQSNYGFSPFLYCAKYDLGLINEAQVDVIFTNTEQISSSYIGESLEKDTFFSQINYFTENHTYTDIRNINFNLELDYTNPQIRYPFADQDPYAYLIKESKNINQIRLRTYSKVSNYDIGKNASENSVRVYVNGIEDKGAVYSSTSGFVTPSVSISDLDKIYITWDDGATSFSNGAFVTGLGFIYNLFKNTTVDVTLTARIPFSPFIKFATPDNQFLSFVALTGGIKYTTENLTTSDSLSLAIENENIKNAFFISPVNSNKQQIYYLSQTDGFKTHVVPSLNRVNSVELNYKDNGTVNNYNGIRDENISGYKIPLTWNFENIDNSTTAWASVDIKLNSTSIISNSSAFEIAIQNEQILNSDDYELYLQLGIKAENEFSGEDTSSIPTWLISKKQNNTQNDESVISYFDFTETGWQFITIQIPDSQRVKLNTNKDIRLILVKKNFNITDNQNGNIFIGAYEPHQQNSIVNCNSGIFVTNTTTQAQTSITAQNFFESDYYADKISWQINDDSLQEQDLFIESKKYFPEISFSNYKYLNFDFALLQASTQTAPQSTNPCGLKLLLVAVAEQNIPALELTVQATALKQFLSGQENFHSVKVDLENGDVWIDETKLSQDKYTLRLNKTINPTQQIFLLNPQMDTTKVTQGSFIYGNIYLTETKTSFTAKNNFNVKYSKDGTLLSKNGLEIFKDPKIEVDSTQTFSNFDTSVSSVAKASITSFDVKYSFDSNFIYNSKSENTNILNNAGHNISTVNPLFSIFNFSEIFRYNYASLLDSSNSFLIDLNAINIPVKLTLYANGQSLQNQNTQKLNSELFFTIPFELLSVESKTNINLNQNSSTKLHNSLQDNYFSSFSQIKKIEFSNCLDSCADRKSILKTNLNFIFNKIDLKTTLDFSMENQFKNITSSLSDTSYQLNLNIPFTIKSNNFTFTYTKKTGMSKNTDYLNSYNDDIAYLFSELQNNSIIFTSIPFYDLFDKQIENKLPQNNLNSFYNAKYDLTWKRTLSNSIKDLFIPKAISIGATRDIRKTETYNDIYQLKLTKINSFINLLGKDGKYKLFKFFNQDEFTSSLTSSIKLPFGTNETTTYLFSYYLTYLMYIDNDNILKTGIDFTISDSQNWKTRSTILWNHKGNQTILFYIPKLIFKELKMDETKIQRKEIFNISFGRTQKEFMSSYEISHECELKIKENYTIFSNFGFNYNQFQTKANSLELKLSVGAKLIF